MASAEKVTVQEERVVVEEREVIRVELSECEALLLRTLGHFIESSEVWEIVHTIGVAAGVSTADEAGERLGVRCVIEDGLICHVDPA